MSAAIDYDELDASLRHCGSSWNAGQAHGMLCGQLAVLGAAGGASWLGAVLENTDPNDAQRDDCEAKLDQLYAHSYRQLAERLSEFAPLLPEDNAPTGTKTEAMGQWCEGFLHGLVATASNESLKKKLAAEPLSEIIKDLLQISRATVDDTAAEDDEDQAYEELHEYIRVAAQLVYEELDEFRNPASEPRANDAADSVLH
jgi:yecA family protein